MTELAAQQVVMTGALSRIRRVLDAAERGCFLWSVQANHTIPQPITVDGGLLATRIPR